VVSAPAASVVETDKGAKVKVPKCRVEFVGDRLAATDYLTANGAAGMAVVGAVCAAGDRGTATAGYRGTATAGGWGTATAGDEGTATAGDRGTATAGDRGEIRIRWYDGKRYRLAVGYVGEGGIKAGTAYRVAAGKFVEAGRDQKANRKRGGAK
jgi:hypothetical protein